MALKNIASIKQYIFLIIFIEPNLSIALKTLCEKLVSINYTLLSCNFYVYNVSSAYRYALIDTLAALQTNKAFAARYVMPYTDRLNAVPEFMGQLAGESNNKNGMRSLKGLIPNPILNFKIQ